MNSVPAQQEGKSRSQVPEARVSDAGHRKKTDEATRPQGPFGGRTGLLSSLCRLCLLVCGLVLDLVPPLQATEKWHCS